MCVTTAASPKALRVHDERVLENGVALLDGFGGAFVVHVVGGQEAQRGVRVFAVVPGGEAPAPLPNGSPRAPLPPTVVAIILLCATPPLELPPEAATLPQHS